MHGLVGTRKCLWFWIDSNKYYISVIFFFHFKPKNDSEFKLHNFIQFIVVFFFFIKFYCSNLSISTLYINRFSIALCLMYTYIYCIFWKFSRFRILNVFIHEVQWLQPPLWEPRFRIHIATGTDTCIIFLYFQ